MDECDVCGLPDSGYRGDGIGSCGCLRCPCGMAIGSQHCVCDATLYYDDDPYDDGMEADRP